MPLTTGQTAQASARALRFILLIDLVFPSGAIYCTDLDRPITVGGTLYSPSSILQGVTGAADHIDGKARRIGVQLSGLDATLRARAIGNRCAFGTLLLRLAFCDDTFTPVDTPVVINTGILSNAELNYDDGSGTLEISAETSVILLRRDSRQLASDQGQRQRFAGDGAFAHVSEVTQRKISWAGVGGFVFTDEAARFASATRANNAAFSRSVARSL